MKLKSITLTLGLILGVCCASISQATIIQFDSMGVVEFGLGLPGLPVVGAPVADELILDIADDGEVTAVISFRDLNPGGSFLDVLEFDLSFIDGALDGFIFASVRNFPVLTVRDVWTGDGGVASFTVLIDGTLLGGSPGPVVAFGGTNTFAAVPEPGSMALFGIGFAGLAIIRRRQQRV